MTNPLLLRHASRSLAATAQEPGLGNLREFAALLGDAADTIDALSQAPVASEEEEFSGGEDRKRAHFLVLDIQHYIANPEAVAPHALRLFERVLAELRS